MLQNELAYFAETFEQTDWFMTLILHHLEFQEKNDKFFLEIPQTQTVHSGCLDYECSEKYGAMTVDQTGKKDSRQHLYKKDCRSHMSVDRAA